MPLPARRAPAALFLPLALLLLLAPPPAASAPPPPCGGGDVRCPPGSPSAGVCVPALAPWCALPLFRNPYAPAAERAGDLLPRLSLQQKVNMLQTTPANSSAVPALGVEQVTMAECLHGYCSRSPSTLFPQSMSLAASFNPGLLRRVAAAIATEARAWRNNWTAAGNSSVAPPALTCFAPQINIVRDPRWGRGQETYGEEPHLTAAMAAAYVSGLQYGEAGSNADRYILAAATAKHAVGYQGASSRGTFSPTEVFLSWRDQVDTYEVAWRAVLAAGTQAVMCAYSSLCHDDTNTTCSLPPPAGYGRSHGVPMCADAEMLNGFLRNASRSGAAWDGMVTGDCGAFQFVQTDHLWAPDQEHAAADVIHAGGDFDCSISVGRGFAALVNATALGLVSEADVDASLTRLLTMQLRLGFYDPPEMVPYTQIGMEVVNSAAHRGLAAEAARQGLVLLRNGAGLLPLSAAALGAPGALLVTGPNAQLFATGNYNSETDHNVTALEGLSAYLPGLAFEPGCVSVASNDTSLIAAAAAAAAAAKVVVAVMGLDGSQEYEDSTRQDLALPGVQDALLQALAATGTPVVLVLVGGSAVAPAPATLAAVAAVVWAGYGGEEAGTALADALFGAFNPGGRLPITHYRSVDDLPPYLNMSMTGLPFGRTLRYFTGPAPLYRFGEGRSYSSFLLSPTAAAAPGDAIAMCSSLAVSVNVSNAGPLDGDTVLQAYVRVRGAPRLTPLLSLAAFERVSRAAGGAASEVAFVLPPRAFAIVDGGPSDAAPPEWVLFPSSIDVFLGEESPASEADWAPPRGVTLRLTGDATPLSACGPF